jgi:hypothetical protein
MVTNKVNAIAGAVKGTLAYVYTYIICKINAGLRQALARNHQINRLHAVRVSAIKALTARIIGVARASIQFTHLMVSARLTRRDKRDYLHFRNRYAAAICVQNNAFSA